ncbi:MAG: glycerophosphodiester phosphodiesterase [Planctomycetota bacterium]
MCTLTILLPALLLTLATFPARARVPTLIAHRGASHDAPENTLAAFKLAFELGADGIEGDFYLTADGQIVCIHDADTERTAGVKLEVARSTLAELKALDVGSWKDPRFAGERIPTLRAVLAVVPHGKKLLIEIKCGPEILPALERELAKASVPRGQIAVISFDAEVLRFAKSRLPDLSTYWLTSYQRDQETRELHPTLDEVLATLKRTGADALDTKDDPAVVDQPFVEALHKAGYGVHAWTVDDPDAARRLCALGIVSITTNRPDHLRKELSGDVDAETREP